MKCITYLVKFENLKTLKEVNINKPPKTDGTVKDALSYYNFTIEQIHENQEIETINIGDPNYTITLFRLHWYVKKIIKNDPEERNPKVSNFIEPLNKTPFKFKSALPETSEPLASFEETINAFYDIETIYDIDTKEFACYQVCLILKD
jgi:hypothetical protein